MDIKSTRALKQALFFCVLPAILLDGVFVEELGNIKSYQPTHPVFQLALTLILVAISPLKITKFDFWFCIIFFGVLIVYTLIGGLWSFRWEWQNFDLILVVASGFFLSIVILSDEEENALNNLLLGYLVLSVLILGFRASIHFSQVHWRGGMNIFGGASLLHVCLLYGAFLPSQKAYLGFMNPITFFVTLLFLSVIFDNRVIFLVCLCLVLFECFLLTLKYKAYKFVMLLVLLSAGLAYQTIPFLEITITRWARFTEILGSQSLRLCDIVGPERCEMWQFGFDAFSYNWLGYGIGSFHDVFNQGYHSPHSLAVSMMFIAGAPGIISFVLWVFISLNLILRGMVSSGQKVSNNVSKLLMFIGLLLSVNTTGEDLIQVSGYLSPIFLVVLITSFLRLRSHILQI